MEAFALHVNLHSISLQEVERLGQDQSNAFLTYNPGKGGLLHPIGGSDESSDLVSWFFS
jgi:hypothetical protein